MSEWQDKIAFAAVLVSLVSVSSTFYAIRSAARTARETRLFTVRSEAYLPVVTAIVELREYAERSNRTSFQREQPGDVPVLEDGRWLTLLARVELLGTDAVRRNFETLPGTVSRFRIALLGFDEVLNGGSTLEERTKAIDFLKESRAEALDQCSRALDAIRAEVTGTS